MSELLSLVDADSLKMLAAIFLCWHSVHWRGEQSAAGRAALRMQSIQLQTRMWNFVTEVARHAPNPVSMSLVDACSQLYISQQKTMASWRSQIPVAAWVILIVFGVCSNFLIGYHMRAGSRVWLLVVPFVTALAVFMISEIDVPGKGVIHVTPQNLEALQVMLSKGGLAP